MRFLLLFVLLILSGVGFAYMYHPEWFSYNKISSISNISSISTISNTFYPTPTPVPKVWVAPDPSTVYPTTWNTRDGKVYEKVKVLDVKADAVTIMFTNGVETIDLSKLPDNLQRLMNYDPDLASTAATERATQETENDNNFMADQVADNGAVVSRSLLRAREARMIAKLKSRIAAYQQYADAVHADVSATVILHNREPNPNWKSKYDLELKALQTELAGAQKMYDDLPADPTPTPPPTPNPTPASTP